MNRCTVVVVTDPLCSWCWGMAPAIEQVAHRMAEEVAFELLLGGVNVDSTQPVGAYGNRLLMRIWREVSETTGQRFGFRLPRGFVYNSVPACLAVAAVRGSSGRPPFGYLHRLQQHLFQDGLDISDPDLLVATAQDLGFDGAAVAAALDDSQALADLRQEFAGARVYGTQALPNVLTEADGRRRLLVGGYADGAMLEMLIRQRLATAG